MQKHKLTKKKINKTEFHFIIKINGLREEISLQRQCVRCHVSFGHKSLVSSLNPPMPDIILDFLGLILLIQIDSHID